MKTYKADLHIHTVLSPCGDLEMSPRNIVQAAKNAGLDMVGITDHNSTKQCKVVKALAAKNDLHVLCGVEINSLEEVHCLAFFDTSSNLDDFQNYIDKHLTFIPNDTKKFGYQVLVDANDVILEHEDRLLLAALDVGIEAIEKKVHQLDGLFIPAHVNRERFSVLSQLGFIPTDLEVDALEISRHMGAERFSHKYPNYRNHAFITSSDAHFVEDIGKAMTQFRLESPTVNELRKALKNQDGRKIEALIQSN